MPRRLKLPTRELGALELHVIYDYGGTWEEAWRPLQGTPIASIFTTVSKANYDHALLGWTKPFVDGLGLSPAAALRKLPAEAQQCAVRNRCVFYDKRRCIPSSSKLPWCYEPGGIDDDTKRHLSAEVIGFWRQGVYVVVVQEPT
jgi:hypothetical protein